MNEIEEKLPGAASESLELRGFFVLMFAALETMLADTSSYYLRCFPEKFSFKDAKFGKDEILEAILAIDLIEQQIAKKVMFQAYENLRELLQEFGGMLGITAPSD